MDWDFEEFAAFLLIHAGYADLELTEAERAQIKSRISSESFDKIHQQYLIYDEGEVLQVILRYKGVHYPTPERKQELLSRMRALFESDGDYSKLEHNMMHFYERLL